MQLKMFRPPLPLPEVTPPAGFAIRPMRPGEEAAWSYCCLGEFGIESVTPEGFASKMSDIPVSEVFYICNAQGQPVGTATARLRPEDEAPFLHYIAVHPDWRGKGLAKPLIAAVLQRHSALGRQARGCFLTTDDPRLPAINSYVKTGYRPVLWSEDAVPRWCAVMQQLGIPKLETYGEDGALTGAITVQAGLG